MKKANLAIITKFKGSKNTIFDSVQISNGLIYCTDGANYAGYKTAFAQGQDGVLSAQDLVKIAGRGDITNISIDSGAAVIEVGKKKFTIFAGVDPVTLPKNDATHSGNLEINKDVLNLKNFVGTDDLRPAITGVLFDSENKNFVATDAHRMRWIGTEFNAPKDVIFDKAIFNVPAGVYKSEILHEHLYLENENFIFYISLIDARYPAYKTVIPDHSVINISLSKKIFKEVLSDAIICANPTTNAAALRLQDGILTFDTCDIDLAKSYKSEDIDHQTTGHDDFTIGFNIKAMDQILNATESENIKLSMSTPNRAMLINDNTLLMPVIIK